MPVQVSSIMIGVEDLARSKEFYAGGLGCKIEHDTPAFASFDLGNGSSLALYGWKAVAGDAGVSSEGSGFRGFSLHYIVSSREEVDEVMRTAVSAGASVVKEATATQYGYFAYFSDPDGYLWKIATAA